jgi:hypothetical protein
MRNILSHTPGSVKGRLSAACFTCLSDLLSVALSTLDAALLHLKEPVVEGLVVSEGVEQWGEEKVLEFFQKNNFPTAGLIAGQVDGITLLNLLDGDNTESDFTKLTPEGLARALTASCFIGRFKTEMAKLKAGSNR